MSHTRFPPSYIAMPTMTTALLRLRYVAATPTQARHICQVLASALRLPPSSASMSACLHLGNALLEVTAIPPWVTLARHSVMLNRPDVARLQGVDVFASTSNTTSSATTSSSSYHEARAWLSEDRPIVTPIVRTVPMSSSAFLVSATSPQVREIVLGASQNWAELASVVTDELKALPCPGLPHVYALQGAMASVTTCNKAPVNTSSIDAADFLKQQQQHSSSLLGRNGIAMRLLHSPMSALVLHVEAGGLAAAKEDLWRRGVEFEEIGGTGATEGQILLSSPHLRGLDVRICDGGAALSPFFNEGDEVLREHVFEELNPALSQPLAAVGEDGKQASSPAAAYRSMGTGMGDCWSEFRTQLKRPGGFFTSSSSSSASSSK